MASDTTNNVKAELANKEDEKLKTLVQTTVKSMFEELMPMFMASMQMQRPAPTAREIQLRNLAGKRCPVCKQFESGCEGKHVKMVVFPVRYPEFSTFFAGYGLNGVWYRSQNPNHYIEIPASAEADCRNIIANYEEQERVSRLGRSGGHDFGNAMHPKPPSGTTGW